MSPFWATMLPFSATIDSATICCRFGQRQQSVAVSGDKVLPFQATMLPFSATIASATIVAVFGNFVASVDRP